MTTRKTYRYNDNFDLERVQPSGSHDKISWGRPAQIVTCRMDRACPVCETREPAKYEHTTLVSGIGFVKEGNEIVGAKCFCGYSF